MPPLSLVLLLGLTPALTPMPFVTDLSLSIKLRHASSCAVIFKLPLSTPFCSLAIFAPTISSFLATVILTELPPVISVWSSVHARLPSVVEAFSPPDILPADGLRLFTCQRAGIIDL